MDLEFDIPFRELEFHRVPNKSLAFILPMVNRLVELIETPFLVVSLNEIDIMNLERVGLEHKAFDMPIVWTCTVKPFMVVRAIAMHVILWVFNLSGNACWDGSIRCCRVSLGTMKRGIASGTSFCFEGIVACRVPSAIPVDACYFDFMQARRSS